MNNVNIMGGVSSTPAKTPKTNPKELFNLKNAFHSMMILLAFSQLNVSCVAHQPAPKNTQNQPKQEKKYLGNDGYEYNAQDKRLSDDYNKAKDAFNSAEDDWNH